MFSRSEPVSGRKRCARAAACCSGALLVLAVSASGAEPAPPVGQTQIWVGVVPFTLSNRWWSSELAIGIDGPVSKGVLGAVLGVEMYQAEGAHGTAFSLGGAWGVRGNDKVVRPRLSAGMVVAGDLGWQVGVGVDVVPPGRPWIPLSVEVRYRDLVFTDDVTGDSFSADGLQINVGFKFHTTGAGRPASTADPPGP